MRRWPVLIVLFLAGCGAAHPSRTATKPIRAYTPVPDVPQGQATLPPFTISLAPGRLLVFFKRTVGADPLASQLTVEQNGDAEALVTNGGPGGEHRQYFRLKASRLHRLRALLDHARLRDTSCCNPDYYIYFISLGGRSWRLEQQQVPRSARSLLDDLDAITDTHTGYDGPSG